MKALILSAFLLITPFALFAESNKVPVYYFKCEGYKKDSGQFWTMNGIAHKVDKTETPIANADGSYTYDVTISGSGELVKRQAFGKLPGSSFYFMFFPNDLPGPIEFEGIMTVENTASFPVVTRFAAHGWLGHDPLISTSAFDFVCELN